MNEYSDRRHVIQAIFLIVGVIFICRLFYLQVIEDKYLLSAKNNVLRETTIYPARGLIYDRHGEVLVYNQAIYDLMVTPRQTKGVDTLLLCNLLDISVEDFLKRLKKARKYSRFKASLFEPQILVEEYANIQERLYEFNGFHAQPRTVRKYPYSATPHVLGYIGEVNQKHIQNSEKYYKRGDYIGISGIEQFYEKQLRGKRGVKKEVVDVHNRIMGSFKEGKYDTAAIEGKNITLTLDKDLQLYGEVLMNNKIGSIVVIEPATGEILAMVSSPNYDPNLLSGRNRGKNYGLLSKDPKKPLFNRPTMAHYPPGSIFKLILALIAQKDEVINSATRYPCSMGYHLRGLTIRCHDHESMLNLHESIQHSCNAYYCEVFKRLLSQKKFKNSAAAFKSLGNTLNGFGLGQKLELDIYGELKGLIPSDEYYNKIYGENRWKYSTIISLSIGQGELGVTPLQMANLTAIIANKGFYINPHFIKVIGDSIVNLTSSKVNKVPVQKESYYNIIIDGMEDVVKDGTAQLARIDSITVCGKTGTSQNPHGEDHSIFIAFAPKENPKIAISVVVENAGFGGVWAAPIASLMIEKYLTDSIASNRKWKEKRILEASFID